MGLPESSISYLYDTLIMEIRTSNMVSLKGVKTTWRVIERGVSDCR